MPDVSFSNLLAVCLIAFAVPLSLGFLPKVRVPAVVLEIVLGIVVGPSVLGFVRPDLPVQILSVIGLAFLLFLAGLEVDLHRLRGSTARRAGLGALLSLGLGLAVGLALYAAGRVRSPAFIGIVLLAASLRVVPILKDAGESASGFGQLVIAGSTIGDFGAVILLSLLISKQASGIPVWSCWASSRSWSPRSACSSPAPDGRPVSCRSWTGSPTPQRSCAYAVPCSY